MKTLLATLALVGAIASGVVAAHAAPSDNSSHFGPALKRCPSSHGC